jgi:predicted lipoprotein
MAWARWTLIAACAALALSSCSKDDAPTQDTVVVAWRDYTPGLQNKIDAMARAKDCQGLLIEFNEIGGTNLAVRTKFGHGNEEILQYIDDLERQTNCLGDVTTTS